MQSFVALAFAGVAVAQQGYPAPQAYGPPPAYGQSSSSSSSSSSTTVSTTTVAPTPYQTPSCPAPGSTDSQGRYSCNPAHQYPAGQTCELIDGCYFLVYPKTSSSSSSATTPAVYKPTTTEPAKYTTTSAKTYPSSTTVSCPAPGSTDSQGRYSCNPAHQYPAGQTCKIIDGCPYLEYPKTTSSAPVPAPYPTTTSSESHPAVYPTTYEVKNTTSSAPAYKPTTVSCPAPGSTDSKGRYSCNPAHQYPAGQTCKIIDGCPYLEYPKTTSSAPVYHPTAPAYTTEVVTAYTTYCPEPTTFTHEASTYTITKATTVVLPCKGGCTVTKEIPVYTTVPVYLNTTVTAPVYKPTTVVVSQPPKVVTTVETAYTTYCPEPTTFTHEASTYTITKATTVVLPCKEGCTVTKEVPQPPKTVITTATVPTTYTVPSKETTLVTVPVEYPTAPVYKPEPEPSKPVEVHPTAPAYVPAPSAPAYTPAANTTVPVVPVATTSAPAVYTGAAAQQTAGAMLAVAALAFFL